MSLHVIVLLCPYGAQERGCTASLVVSVGLVVFAIGGREGACLSDSCEGGEALSSV